MQALYERLACCLTKNGSPVYVFWDQKCLNYGQNWEAGFLFGIQNSRVIILLISMKAGSCFFRKYLLCVAGIREDTRCV